MLSWACWTKGKKAGSSYCCLFFPVSVSISIILLSWNHCDPLQWWLPAGPISECKQLRVMLLKKKKKNRVVINASADCGWVSVSLVKVFSKWEGFLGK